MTTPRRTQQQRVQDSARRLAEAAIALIAERGYAAATTAEIGSRAGYSRAMVHARYGSKDALLDAILKDQYESRMDIDPDPSLTGLDQVLARIEAFRTFAAEDPDFLRAIFVLHFEAVRGDAYLRVRVADWLGQERRGFVNAIEVGIKDGTIRDDLDPDDSATDVMSTGIGIAYWWVTDPAGYPVDTEIRRWSSKVRLELATSTHWEPSAGASGGR